MIIAVASRKASPGVTSLTAWLAWFWPDVSGLRLIVEADASGGTLAARWSGTHGLTWDPGLLALSTTRAGLDARRIAQLAQPVADGVLVAAAPPAPDQVGGALARWGRRGPDELAGLAGSGPGGTVAFADCGRLSASSPGIGLATRAALTVLVCRPRLDEVQALLPAVPELQGQGCTLGLVSCGDGPYPPGEIARAAGVPLLGVVPADTGAATAFDRDGFNAGRAFRRSRLAGSLADLAGAVHAFVSAPPAAAPVPGAGAPGEVAPGAEAVPSWPPPPGHRAGEPGSVSPALAAARAGRSAGSGAGRSARSARAEPDLPRIGPPPMPPSPVPPTDDHRSAT